MTDEKTISCVLTPVTFRSGEKLNPLIFMPEDPDASARCPDCNILRGGFHHPGCDIEVCPKCSGQLISCGCVTG